MAKGVCRVLIPGTLEEAFLVIVALLKTVGATLANPGNAKITTWTDNGEQIEISNTNVVGEVASGNVGNVQFWTTESEDVFVAWKKEGIGCRFSIYLDGVEADVAVKLASKFSEAVLLKYRMQYRDGRAFSIEFE